MAVTGGTEDDVRIGGGRFPRPAPRPGGAGMRDVGGPVVRGGGGGGGLWPCCLRDLRGRSDMMNENRGQCRKQRTQKL